MCAGEPTGQPGSRSRATAGLRPFPLVQLMLASWMRSSSMSGWAGGLLSSEFPEAAIGAGRAGPAAPRGGRLSGQMDDLVHAHHRMWHAGDIVGDEAEQRIGAARQVVRHRDGSSGRDDVVAARRAVTEERRWVLAAGVEVCLDLLIGGPVLDRNDGH